MGDGAQHDFALAAFPARPYESTFWEKTMIRQHAPFRQPEFVQQLAHRNDRLRRATRPTLERLEHRVLLSTSAFLAMPPNLAGISAINGADVRLVGDPTVSTVSNPDASLVSQATATTHFALSAPAGVTAGSAFTFTVAAKDSSNSTDTSYAGTVHFSSTDPQAVLSGDVTLSNGVGTFSATLETAGAQTITATDTATSSITGATNSITVTAASATHYSVSTPSTTNAGTAFSVTVTALDQFNNVASGYTGTIHFTKTDSGAGSAVPGDYTFVAGDNGVHTFTNGVTFVTAGS